MFSRLSVIFYIIVCLEIGGVLAVLPWFPEGWWANNYFLLMASHKTGFYGLQSFVASGWVRGAVSGLGILNLGMAFWEVTHFRQSVRALQAEMLSPASSIKETSTSVAAQPQADSLSDYPRRNH